MAGGDGLIVILESLIEVAGERLEAATEGVRPLVPGVELEYVVEVLNAARELAQVAVGETAVEPGVGVGGLEGEAVVEVVDGIAITAEELVGRGPAAVGLWIVQTKLDRVRIGVDGLRQFSQILERGAEGGVKGGRSELECRGLLPVGDGYAELARRAVDVSAERQGLRVARAKSDRAAQVFESLLLVAEIEVELAALVEGGRVAG